MTLRVAMRESDMVLNHDLFTTYLRSNPTRKTTQICNRQHVRASHPLLLLTPF